MNKATVTGQPSDGDCIEDRIVSRIYGVALDPLSYGDLLDDWEELIAPVRQGTGREGPLRLPRADLGLHFRRLADFLDHAERDDRPRPEDEALAPYRRVAAFCVTRILQTSAANDVAREIYGLDRGVALAGLPMVAEDLQELRERILELFSAATDESRLLRLHVGERGAPDETRAILFRLRRVTPDIGEPFVLVVTSHLRWPAGLSEALARSFGLTASEIEVLRGLTQSQSPREIADRRERSVETVRAQIKSLLQKTETRSQGDLVRLALSAMDVADPISETPATVPRTRWSGGGATLKRLPFRTLRRPDGRQVDYLLLGCPQGKPVVYLGSFLNLLRWPAAAEAEAGRRGLKIISVIRPGYMGSTPLPVDAPRLETVAADIAAIADAEGARRFPIVVLGQDANYASTLNGLFPGRITGVVGCAATLPVDYANDFEGMGRWHRFIYSSARYTPNLLPFMIRAALAMARRTDEGDFLRTVLAESPCDQALMRETEVLEAILAGTEEILKCPATPRALADEFRFRCQRGSDRLMQNLRGNFPVHMLHGAEDLHSRPETVAQRARDYPWVRFEQLEGAGSLVLFRHWDRVLDLVTVLTKK
jgi:DNA-binding CsgD family transcriptional regulator/pimeloyl-ACP methyl ester carboxylesterase